MKLRKTLLILFASAMLGAAAIAPHVALAQPFPGPPPGGPPPGPIGGPPPGLPGGGLAGLPGPVVLRGLGPPLDFLVFPASTPPLVSLVPADLLVPGPLAFLVLPAREAVVLGFSGGHGSVYGHSGTYAYGAPGAIPTATPPTMATAAPAMAMATRAMATSMSRGDTATGRQWRLRLQQQF